MTPTPSDAAGLAVFNTTELSELILKNLDFEDLLRARQVNQFLRDVVDGSRPLQQKLYLLPVMASAEHLDKLNPLLWHILGLKGFKLCNTIKHMQLYNAATILNMNIQRIGEVSSYWSKHVPDYFADMYVASGSLGLSITLWRVWDTFPCQVSLPGSDVKIKDLLEALERSRRSRRQIWA